MDICLIVEFLFSDISDGEKVENNMRRQYSLGSLLKFSYAVKDTCKQAIFRKDKKRANKVEDLWRKGDHDKRRTGVFVQQQHKSNNDQWNSMPSKNNVITEHNHHTSA